MDKKVKREAEKIRKIYTYDMVHAVLVNAGTRKNYYEFKECFSDPEILQFVENTLSEVSEGLQKAYGFTAPEMSEWNEKVLADMKNPVLQERSKGIGVDLIRKLGREECLVGPALMCRENGILPYYLSEVIAFAFLFGEAGDKGFLDIRESIKERGIKETITHYCGLEKENDLVWLIERIYQKTKNNETQKDHSESIAVMKKAFELGFRYEKQYRGCA